MKTEAKARRKLKQVIFRHLKKRLAATLKKKPENCLYNRQPSTHPKMSPVTGLPRVCIHAERAGVICDIPHPNSADYKGCQYFSPLKSSDQVRKEFVELAKSPREVVAQHMPDAAALMWVLDQEDGVPKGDAESAAKGEEGSGDEEEDDEPVAEEPQPDLADMEVPEIDPAEPPSEAAMVKREPVEGPPWWGLWRPRWWATWVNRTPAPLEDE